MIIGKTLHEHAHHLQPDKLDHKIPAIQTTTACETRHETSSGCRLCAPSGHTSFASPPAVPTNTAPMDDLAPLLAENAALRDQLRAALDRLAAETARSAAAAASTQSSSAVHILTARVGILQQSVVKLAKAREQAEMKQADAESELARHATAHHDTLVKLDETQVQLSQARATCDRIQMEAATARAQLCRAETAAAEQASEARAQLQEEQARSAKYRGLYERARQANADGQQQLKRTERRARRQAAQLQQQALLTRMIHTLSSTSLQGYGMPAGQPSQDDMLAVEQMVRCLAPSHAVVTPTSARRHGARTLASPALPADQPDLPPTSAQMYSSAWAHDELAASEKPSTPKSILRRADSATSQVARGNDGITPPPKTLRFCSQTPDQYDADLAPSPLPSSPSTPSTVVAKPTGGRPLDSPGAAARARHAGAPAAQPGMFWDCDSIPTPRHGAKRQAAAAASKASKRRRAPKAAPGAGAGSLVLTTVKPPKVQPRTPLAPKQENVAAAAAEYYPDTPHGFTPTTKPPCRRARLSTSPFTPKYASDTSVDLLNVTGSPIY